MTNQMAAPVDPDAYGHTAADDGRLGPDVAITGKTEDLYVFTVKHITLKKGERMVVPVTEFHLDYSDTYSLDIPFTPPREMLAGIGGVQQAEGPASTRRRKSCTRSAPVLTTGPSKLR